MGFDYARYFGEIALTTDLTTPPGDRAWRLSPLPRGERHEVVLYLGCNVLRTSHLAQTATAIFDRLGLDYVAVGGPAYCCGIVHHGHGDTAAGRGMGEHTVELFRRMEAATVVIWCPSCIYYYDEILAAKLPFRVLHTTEFLVERLPELRFTQTVPARVALHHHCLGDARRREGAAARRLLEAVPGVTYVEIGADERFGRSCSPAVQEALGVETWDAMVRDQVARARDGGAGILATTYHGCQRMLCEFEDGVPTVEHYITVFGRALGIELEDRFKKYKLWRDPERVFEDMTPCFTVNGVDPARARELVERTFGPQAGR